VAGVSSLEKKMNDKKTDDTTKTKPDLYSVTIEKGINVRVQFTRDIELGPYSRNAIEAKMDLQTGLIAGELMGFRFLMSIHNPSISLAVLK
jgi:hypothetical protein